jgi:hypothetical protein
MDKEIAKEIRELDNVVFDMYEKDVLNTDQYSQILTQTINVRQSVKNLTIDSVRERYIKFAVWIQEKHYYKKTTTHPKNIGKWWSDYEDNGYLTDEELLREFLNAL